MVTAEGWKGASADITEARRCDLTMSSRQRAPSDDPRNAWPAQATQERARGATARRHRARWKMTTARA
eukprot:3209619-Alexandrium_andersonii.AAC.1